MALVRQALHKKVHGYMPDSTIPIIASFTVDAKRYHKKNGVYVPFWDRMFDSEKLCIDDLLTNNGRDVIHNQSFMNGSQPAQFNYYAISSDATFSADFTTASTTINNEINTPTHMIRHICTSNWGGITESYSHSAGTNTTVIVAAFENNTGSGTITVYGYGNANASSGVTIGFGSAFTGVALNSAAGAYDCLKLTVTLTLG
jgi:hypothetical protein